MTKIEVVQKVPIDHEDASSYDKFVEKYLPEKQCRWAVYDMEYDLGEGKRNKLVFVSW
jgi:cofilin